MINFKHVPEVIKRGHWWYIITRDGKAHGPYSSEDNALDSLEEGEIADVVTLPEKIKGLDY